MLSVVNESQLICQEEVDTSSSSLHYQLFLKKKSAGKEESYFAGLHVTDPDDQGKGNWTAKEEYA